MQQTVDTGFQHYQNPGPLKLARKWSAKWLLCQNMENYSSDSNLDEDELDQLVTLEIPQRTKNSTQWAMKLFECESISFLCVICLCCLFSHILFMMKVYNNGNITLVI